MATQPLCGAIRKYDHTPCQNHAVLGAARCRMHGGVTSRRKNAERTAVQDAQRALKAFGQPVSTTPMEALQDLLDNAMGTVAYLRAYLSDQDERAVYQRLSEEVKTGSVENYTVRKTEAVASVHLELLLREEEHLRRVAETAVRCGVMEREAELSARTVRTLDAVLTRILDHFGISTALPANRTVIAAAFAWASEHFHNPNDGSDLDLSWEAEPLHRRELSA